MKKRATPIAAMKMLFEVAAFLPVMAVAQIPPSDQELKAIYCLQVANKRAATFRNGVSQIQDSGIRAYFQGLADQAQSDGDRLRSYVAPKMQYLDTLALAAAANRANADLDGVDEAMSACFRQCSDPNMDPRTEIGKTKATGCINSCIAAKPHLARVQSCNKLDWLPF